MPYTIIETKLNSLPVLRRGKVRDIYDLGEELLIVATDRISCFDVILPTPIPEKGKILTSLSNFWFKKMEPVIQNHLSGKQLTDIISDPEDLSVLKDRSVIAKKTKVVPVEAIVRGYISGSAWKEYAKHKTICGQQMHAGLKESEKLPEPIFTPSTKAEQGAHDENISFEKMTDLIGKELGNKIKDASLKIYNEASKYALTHGIIIADTKFEFGILDGKLILIDEALIPDSSRFWPLNEFQSGKSQPSFDKQFVRDYLLSTNWDMVPPAPQLPEKIVKQTTEKYKEAFNLLTKN